MNRNIAYNILLADIPRRANAAADFLSRKQTDPNQILEIQLQKSYPMKKIEINVKAKTPDPSMIAIETDQPEPVKPQSHLFIGRYYHNSNRALQNLIPQLNDLSASESKDTISEGCLIKRAPEVNSNQRNDPLNYFQTSNTNAKSLNIPEEQKKDPVIRKVIGWIENGCADDLTYASFELTNYHKHLMKLHKQKSTVVLRHWKIITLTSLCSGTFAKRSHLQNT